MKNNNQREKDNHRFSLELNLGSLWTKSYYIMPLSKNDHNIIITKIALIEDTNRRAGNEAKDSVRVSLPR